MKLHSLGEQLRAARIKKELSLYDVEKISGVEAQFLLAMEMDQLKALPEDIQQEALEKYATSVGLDGKRLFEEQRQNEQKLKKEKKPVADGEGDEVAEDDEGDEQEEEQKSSSHNKVKDKGPKRSAAEIARERAEKRAALAQQIAERGINKILGTLGGDSEGAIADVLRGGDVGADQDDLLSQVDGIGVATGETGGSLKGPAGGKGSGEAADISQLKVKGGDKSVKTAGPGKEKKIKGKSVSIACKNCGS